MRQVDYMEAAERAMKQIKEGAFLTVKAGESLNTMTIGWGTIGYVWRKPIFMIAVRSSRHTFGLVEKAPDFSVTVPYGDMRQALAFCGTRSGKDTDKIKACSLETAPARTIATPIIRTAGLHFECRTVLRSAIDPERLDASYDFFYPEKDYHTLYFGEILACYETD
jgi:flavin reductase (DIM6/NTAB) family NADH-FMN oxidoreductase RutF